MARLFPIENLEFLPGEIWGEDENVTIEIALKPFVLEGQTVNTSVRLDRIALPTTNLTALENQSFQFPVNPTDGYIDGSVYIDGAHHPIDVTNIAFGTFSRSGLRASFQAKLMLEFEGLHDFTNTDLVIDTVLQAKVQD